MTISIKEVEHVAVLARLQLKENEKEKYVATWVQYYNMLINLTIDTEE